MDGIAKPMACFHAGPQFAPIELVLYGRAFFIPHRKS